MRGHVQHGAARRGDPARRACGHVRGSHGRTREPACRGLRRRHGSSSGPSSARHRRTGTCRRRTCGSRGWAAPVPHRDAQLRRDRSRGDRRVSRPRRLPGPGEGSSLDVAGTSHRGAEGQRPARPRRRRLPGLAQVEPDTRVAGRGAPHRLQRRRGGSGRLHGPQRSRGRSPRRPRGHDPGWLRDRREAGLLLHSSRIPAGDPAYREGDPPGES